MSLDFDTLSGDEAIKEKLTNYHNSITNIEAILDVVLSKNESEIKDKINLDLFLAYSMNTLVWMYCKSQNIDPNSINTKSELARVRDAMITFKKSQERQARPRVNVEVAERFVRHGTKIHKKRPHTDGGNNTAKDNKKRKT